MRASAFSMLLLFWGMATFSSAHAIEPVLVGSELAKAIDLPDQTAQTGVADVLLELRAERLNSSLLVLTHFPQGLGKDVDKSLAGFADLLHTKAYADTLDRSSYPYEQELGEIAKAMADGKPLPSRQARDWGNVYASIATYSLSHPSANYVSVLFRQDVTGAAAHSNWTYSAVSYNRRTGKELVLQDMFSDKPSIAAALTPVIKKGLQGKGNDLNEGDLDIAMKRIVLTPEGIEIMYAPYEIASYSEGEFKVNIPKQELITLGADPAIWR